MWIRLPLLVILGIAAFSYPIAKQVQTLAFTAEHWVLLAVAFIGMLLFFQGTHKLKWRFAKRPLGLYSFICLLSSLIVALIAILWNLDGVAVAAGFFYFGTLIARGLSKVEWQVVRPHGGVLFMLALPIDAGSSSLVNGYKQFVLRCASALLDAFHVRNIVDRDRIEGLASAIDWSGVATGFWSSSALLAIVAAAIVRQQLRLIHGIFMLPMAVVIGMLMIIGRAAVIVGINAAESLILIHFVSFVVAAYLAWVCLGLVRFTLDPIRGRFKSRFVPSWNRRTIAGLALIRLRNEATALAATNTDTFRLPTIGAIKQESAKRLPRLRRLTRAIRRGFIQSFLFIDDWCRSRHYRRLLPLLPIVLVGITCSLSPHFRPQFAWSENKLSEQYAVDVSTALDRDDRPTMELLTRRLMQFSSVSDSSKFSLSKALLAIDEGSDADAVLATLIDGHENPYAPAQLWQAKRLLASNSQSSGYDQRRAKNYLRESLCDPMLAPEAHWLLGKIYLHAADDENALLHFRAIAKPLPETSLALSLIYKRRGDNPAYLRCLRNAETACKERLLIPDGSSRQMRLLLARSLQFQDRFSDAIKVLEESPDLANDPVTRQAVIIVDIAWFNSLPLDQTVERQQRIQHATKLDATNPLLQKTLAEIAVIETNETVGALRQSAASEILGANKTEMTSGTSLTNLGPEATEMAKHDTAERQFRQAIEAGYESPLMLNNLAWLLAQKSDPAATEEAVVMINRALNMSPKSAELWKTRAEIWQQKGCNLDAIADLEKAIQYGDQSPDVRLTLSELYDRQGDPGTAQRYRNEVSKKSPR